MSTQTISKPNATFLKHTMHLKQHPHLPAGLHVSHSPRLGMAGWAITLFIGPRSDQADWLRWLQKLIDDIYSCCRTELRQKMHQQSLHNGICAMCLKIVNDGWISIWIYATPIGNPLGKKENTCKFHLFRLPSETWNRRDLKVMRWRQVQLSQHIVEAFPGSKTYLNTHQSPIWQQD